jgi:hypothetical protein
VSQDVDIDGPHQLPALSPNTRKSVEQIVASVFEADEPLALIQELLDKPDAGTVGDALLAQQLVLRSFGSFFLGITEAQRGNYPEARNNFFVAAEGFTTIEEDIPRDLARGFGVYLDAVVAIHAKNLRLSQELMVQSQDLFRKAGEFAQRFEGMIDHIQPELLFLQAAEGLSELNFDTARPLIEKASQAAVKVATEYHKDHSTLYCFFMGNSYFYKALYNFSRVNRDFNRFAYDRLTSEIDLNRDAVEAKAMFDKADIHNNADGLQFNF